MSASEAHQCFGNNPRNTDDKWFLNKVFFIQFGLPEPIFPIKYPPKDEAESTINCENLIDINI